MLSNSHSLISEGEAKITKAKTALVLRFPFFAIIALGLRIRNAAEDGLDYVDTMCTDGRHIWWCEFFVDGLTVAEVTGVLAHEVLHVAFRHMFRRGGRDWLIWNIACDYCINHIVLEAGFKLPKCGTFDNEGKYKGWNVYAIYDDLIAEKQKLESQFSLSIPGSPGQGDPEKQGKGQGKSGQDVTPLWGTLCEPRNEDGSEMSDAGKTELIEEIKIKVVQAAEAAKAAGKLPGSLKGLIKATGKPTIDWGDYIHSWVKGSVPDNYTWQRPNRKMLGLYNMILPSMQLNGCGVGVLSVDNSGSVSNNELIKYVTNVLGIIDLCNPTKLYIVQHDSKVQRVDVYEQGDIFSQLKIEGRGGTNITPVFDYVAREIDEQINWMVCFTDMGIPDFPPLSKSPDYPVLWAATGPDSPSRTFGTYLPLRDPLDMKE